VKHEYFEELCAAASVGQASGEDLIELEKHFANCYSCRRAYSAYLGIAAHEFAAVGRDPVLSVDEARECLGSELLTRRFFDRSEREGIVFSDQVYDESRFGMEAPFSRAPRFWLGRLSIRMATAAAVPLLILGVSVYRTALLSRFGSKAPTQEKVVVAPVDVRLSSAKQVSSTADANPKLQEEIERLKAALTVANARLAAKTDEQTAASRDRNKLVADRDALVEQLGQSQHQLTEWQSLTADAQHDSELQKQRAGELEANLAAARAELTDDTRKLAEESAKFNRERQLLAMGRDVSDLMGARNLHILDVMDTDSRGKTRPAFGRIFYTEGKSLVFYAYDLNEIKVNNANYQYQVWARKEGQDRAVRRLGIFYADDKAQNRWVFKCDDADVINEIDSVFVTLGRPNSDPTHPEGSSLMFAYLHGPSNHP
jgi:hypothetical protein